jgi:hypothetical protein
MMRPGVGRFNSAGPVLAHLGGGGLPKGSGGLPKGGGAMSLLGAFHDGGEVTKDGAYLLEKGEKVVPAPGKGQRDSEYRRVYLARKKNGGEAKK